MVKDNENIKKKHRFDLIDFYEVLGIEDRNMPISEIRKKYVKLVVKYHPDKSKDADPQIFALIQRAWDCLGNEEKRKQYDFFLLNEQKAKKGDHNNLKKSFENFMDLKKNQTVDENTKKKAEIDFKLAYSEMDKKNKFNRKKYEEKALDSKEASDRFSNLMLEREQQEIEFTQSRLFPEGTKFDENTLMKFNRAFDDYKYKTEKKQHKDIIERSTGPSAWNTAFNDQSFTSLDSFDNIYGNENDASGLNYGNLNEFGNEVKLDMEYDEIKNMKGAEYVTHHNFKDQDYKKDIEKKLREREIETQKLQNKEFSFFETEQDKSFMFSHEVGDIGSLEWGEDDSEELQEACNRLIELEKMNN